MLFHHWDIRKTRRKRNKEIGKVLTEGFKIYGTKTLVPQYLFLTNLFPYSPISLSLIPYFLTVAMNFIASLDGMAKPIPIFEMLWSGL
mgnify:CR=1 FL=1